MWKISIVGLLILGLVVIEQSGALATTQTQSVGIADFGGSDPDGSGTGTREVIAEVVFSLPAISSFDSFSVQMAHDYGSDVQFEVDDPTGATTVIVVGAGELVGGSHDDDTALGTGSPYSLAEVVDYVLDPTAASPFMDHVIEDGSHLAGGSYFGDAWVAGGFTAGDWTVRVVDMWDNGDTGSLGDVGVSYTVVPEPGTVVLATFVMGGILGLRRRRIYRITKLS